MTPDDHQTPTSISHEKWEVPWVFFHILIVQGIYLYNIKVIEPLTSALIYFLRIMLHDDHQILTSISHEN